MTLSLYGDYIFDARYFAKKIIALGANSSYHTLEFLPDFIGNRMNVNVYNHFEEKVPLSERKGYYAIYERLPLSNDYTFLYAGFSRDSIQKRLWRYGIELCNIKPLLKNSGGHNGAEKHRKDGGTREHLYLKYVLQEDIPFEIPDKEVETLDEYIAHICGSKYNSKRRY